MKGLKITLVMLVAIVIVNIYFFVFIRSTTAGICDLTDMAYEAALKNDDDELSVLTEKINNCVAKCVPVWQIVINHGEVDEVNVALEKLNGSTRTDGEEHIAVYLRELRYSVDNLYQRERLLLYNIF